MPPPFSLLLTVYGGDRQEHLRAAFHSAVEDQTLRPDQVVLVQDGPVSTELAQCLRDLSANSPAPVTIVTLTRNRGLGPALDAGLSACHHDVVARMDADDIAMPHRFAVQLPMIEAGADLVGAGLLEFRTHIGEIIGRRIPPTTPEHIAQFSRIHDPFNHPTVVYRRSAVTAAGGYGDFPLMEDYWLFIRMIALGVRTANSPEPLVYYRIGEGAYERRGGRALLRSELRLQQALRRHGFISRWQYARNVGVRGGYRLLPTWLRRPIYRRFVPTYDTQHAVSAPDASPTTPPAVPALLPEDGVVRGDRAIPSEGST